MASAVAAAASLSLGGMRGGTPRGPTPRGPGLSARGPQPNGILALSAGCPTGGGALLGLKGFAPGPMSARKEDQKVPFLPGYSSEPTPNDGYATGPGALPKLDLATLESLCQPTHRYDMTQRSVTHEERQALKESARNTYRPAIPPAWLKHDRQVLRFAAYFKEPVYENPKENFRTRCCTVYFYLEDGTMMVAEPKVENSGIPQGTFIKRHRVPKPDGTNYTCHDLAKLDTVMIYSRAFKLYDCDEFTREFYSSALGITLPDREPPPLDSFRTAQLRDVEALGKPNSRDIIEGKEFNELSVGGNRKNVKLQQYLENDRKILRFQAMWDDPTKYGARMYYTFHYYLADDTVEILERLARNSGRDPYPVFWRRAMLRKNPHINPTPGMLEPEVDPYKPEDLMVGGYVNVIGRQLFLYDCDDFTRDFYRGYMGMEQDKLEIKDPELLHVTLAYPPHTGIGDELDSLNNCVRLRPKPPKRDYQKLLREGDAAMRFEARLVSPNEEDVGRRFVVVVHLADDSVAVWEKKQRNSGFTEGKFAAKSRKRNAETGEWLKATDFYIGAVVQVNSTTFELIGVDSGTATFMEGRREEFPMANVGTTLAKLVSMKSALAPAVCEPPITEERLKSMAAAAGVELLPHEVYMLISKFGTLDASGPSGTIDTAQLAAAL